LLNSSLLPNDDRNQHNGQYRPDDDKDPDVDFPIGNAKYARPIHQDIHAPVEDLIYHFMPPFVRDMGILFLDQILW
jgi:hypothetical protein